MIAVLLGSSVALTLAIALIGPIASYHREKALERIAFGLLYVVLIWPVFYSQMVMVFYFLRRRRPAEILAVFLLAMLPASFVGSSVVHSMERLIYPGYEGESSFLGFFLLFSVVSIASALLYFYLVWQRIVGAGPVAEPSGNGSQAPEQAGRGDDLAGNPDAEPAANLRGDSNDGHDRAAASSTSPASSTAAAEPAAGERQLAPYRPASQPRELFRLLPAGLGTDLIFIKSEDHYLEVHTTAGSGLIKMRFSDAIAELGDRGIKVHRSYWVATSHVTRAVRTGKRTVLRLTGDHRVPVSVTNMRAVRAVLSR